MAIVFSVEGVSKWLKTTRLSVMCQIPAVVFFGSTRIQNLQLRCTCVAVMISFERAGGDMHVVSTYPETDCPTVDNMLCNCGCACMRPCLHVHQYRITIVLIYCL